MTPMEKAGWTPLPHSDEDLERSKSVPDTPQTRAETYRLAWNDPDFMTRRELRAVRLQLELLKPEMILAERGIRSTVILFGGARLPEPGGEAWAAKNETQKKNLEENSKYYEEARKFARLSSVSTSTISPSARCTSSCAPRRWRCFPAASARWTSSSRR
jgi:hypothetical protein